MNDALLSSINQKTALVKVTKVVRATDSNMVMNVAYLFPTKEIEGTKFIQPLIQSYSQDVGRVTGAYGAAAQAQTASPPAK